MRARKDVGVSTVEQINQGTTKATIDLRVDGEVQRLSKTTVSAAYSKVRPGLR